MSGKPKSILDELPLINQGRVARDGFSFQDHIGVGLLIECLQRDDLHSVWFETYDDIDLIGRDSSGSTFVEFVQVKHEDLQSRYSVTTLTTRKKSSGKDRKGTSLLEKSLNNASYAEESFFRMVTSVDVTSKLKYLKYDRNSPHRSANSNLRGELVEALGNKLDGVTSPNGTKLDEWVDKCKWVVKPKKIDELQSHTISQLHSYVESKKSVTLDYPELLTLYNELLDKVKDASTLDLVENPEANKLQKPDIIELVEQALLSRVQPNGISKGLTKKINKASIPTDYIQNAVSLLQNYKQRLLDNDYLEPNIMYDLEGEINEKLYELKLELDQGKHPEGQNFHLKCLKEVKKISNKDKYIEAGIEEYIAVGYLYTVTNRCPHRFHKIL